MCLFDVNCIIDWSITGVMLRGLGAIAQCLGIIYAARVSSNISSKWHNQRINERRIQHAEKVLGVLYSANAALMRLRSSVISGAEQDAARSSLERTSQWFSYDCNKQNRLIIREVFYARYKKEFKIFEELETYAHTSRPLFEKNLETEIINFRNLFEEVIRYADDYAETTQYNQHEYQKIRSVMYAQLSMSGDVNEFTKKSDKIISNIETICQKTLTLESKT